MKILITGGGGFVGSHAAEFYARQDPENEVVVLDNLSRARLLGKGERYATFNWDHLKQYPNIELVKGDVRNLAHVAGAGEGADVILHTAGQTAVTTSVETPLEDFENNAIGTLNVLETARTSGTPPIVLYCSTNKVYGENVNKIKVVEGETRYRFEGGYSNGLSENFGIDHCEHTPYGCSKLTGDLYMQDYAHLYGLKIGVFRMSAIYGTRQFGVEDQGWVSWLTLATALGKPITIYGDGKQVRDVLFVDDLLRCYDAFIQSDLNHGVFNVGGGARNTLSLLELLDMLEDLMGKRSPVTRQDWRPSDQKVFISDISKAEKLLSWSPRMGPEDGVQRLVQWIEANREIFD